MSNGKPSSGLPNGFDPHAAAGELTHHLQVNAPRHLFVLDKVVQVRVIALLNLLPNLLLVDVAFAARLPWLLIFSMGFSAISVGLWVRAPHLPRRALPDKTTWKGPRRYPVERLVYWFLASVALIAVSAWGIHAGELHIPAKRGVPILLHGTTLWLAVLSLLCAAFSMIARLVDHVDVRNNELRYEYMAVGATWFGWTFFLAVALSMFLGH
jgi:hypothetical protein